MNALISFKKAFANNSIAPQKAEIHSDLLVLVDYPNGEMRMTYALIKNGEPIALLTLINAEPMKGFPCFNIGYAVDKAHRSIGHGKEILRKAFDELTNGFKRAGFPHLYLEAIVSTENTHSNKLANSMLDNNPMSCTDSVSGQPAFQYVRQLF